MDSDTSSESEDSQNIHSQFKARQVEQLLICLKDILKKVVVALKKNRKNNKHDRGVKEKNLKNKNKKVYSGNTANKEATNRFRDDIQVFCNNIEQTIESTISQTKTVVPGTSRKENDALPGTSRSQIEVEVPGTSSHMGAVILENSTSVSGISKGPLDAAKYAKIQTEPVAPVPSTSRVRTGVFEVSKSPAEAKVLAVLTSPTGVPKTSRHTKSMVSGTSRSSTNILVPEAPNGRTEAAEPVTSVRSLVDPGDPRRQTEAALPTATRSHIEVIKPGTPRNYDHAGTVLLTVKSNKVPAPPEAARSDAIVISPESTKYHTKAAVIETPRTRTEPMTSETVIETDVSATSRSHTDVLKPEDTKCHTKPPMPEIYKNRAAHRSHMETVVLGSSRKHAETDLSATPRTPETPNSHTKDVLLDAARGSTQAEVSKTSVQYIKHVSTSQTIRPDTSKSDMELKVPTPRENTVMLERRVEREMPRTTEHHIKARQLHSEAAVSETSTSQKGAKQPTNSSHKGTCRSRMSSSKEGIKPESKEVVSDKSKSRTVVLNKNGDRQAVVSNIIRYGKENISETPSKNELKGAPCTSSTGTEVVTNNPTSQGQTIVPGSSKQNRTLDNGSGSKKKRKFQENGETSEHTSITSVNRTLIGENKTKKQDSKLIITNNYNLKMNNEPEQIVSTNNNRTEEHTTKNNIKSVKQKENTIDLTIDDDDESELPINTTVSGSNLFEGDQILNECEVKCVSLSSEDRSLKNNVTGLENDKKYENINPNVNEELAMVRAEELLAEYVKKEQAKTRKHDKNDTIQARRKLSDRKLDDHVKEINTDEVTSTLKCNNVLKVSTSNPGSTSAIQIPPIQKDHRKSIENSNTTNPVTTNASQSGSSMQSTSTASCGNWSVSIVRSKPSVDESSQNSSLKNPNKDTGLPAKLNSASKPRKLKEKSTKTHETSTPINLSGSPSEENLVLSAQNLSKHKPNTHSSDRNAQKPKSKKHDKKCKKKNTTPIKSQSVIDLSITTQALQSKQRSAGPLSSNPIQLSKIQCGANLPSSTSLSNLSPSTLIALSESGASMHLTKSSKKSPGAHPSKPVQHIVTEKPVLYSNASASTSVTVPSISIPSTLALSINSRQKTESRPKATQQSAPQTGTNMPSSTTHSNPTPRVSTATSQSRKSMPPTVTINSKHSSDPRVKKPKQQSIPLSGMASSTTHLTSKCSTPGASPLSKPNPPSENLSKHAQRHARHSVPQLSPSSSNHLNRSDTRIRSPSMDSRPTQSNSVSTSTKRLSLTGETTNPKHKQRPQTCWRSPHLAEIVTKDRTPTQNPRQSLSRPDVRPSISVSNPAPPRPLLTPRSASTMMRNVRIPSATRNTWHIPEVPEIVPRPDITTNGQPSRVNDPRLLKRFPAAFEKFEYLFDPKRRKK